LLLGGAANMVTIENSQTFCVFPYYAGTLLSGAIIYLMHSGFYTLAIFKEGVTLSIQISPS